MPISLSLNEARRLALAAQGFGRPRPRRPTIAHCAIPFAAWGCCRSIASTCLRGALHGALLPPGRLRPCPAFDDLIYRSGEFAEHWAHEISIIPAETWPLLRYRRETDRVRPWGFSRCWKNGPDYAAWVLEEVGRRGPLAADELPAPDGVDRRIPGAWIGTVPRGVLEAHFLRGRLAAAGRRSDFSRLYDLAERLIPAEHLTRQVEYDDGRRLLLLHAARAHAVGTAKDLGRLFPDVRGRSASASAGIGGVRPIAGGRGGGMAERSPTSIRRQRRLRGSRRRRCYRLSIRLIWCRPRVARLFGFDYRVEIFVPPEKRQYGFYVLPFLLGEELVARVDLKADRANGRLSVLGSWFEGRKKAAVAEALAGELRSARGLARFESVYWPRSSLSSASAIWLTECSSSRRLASLRCRSERTGASSRWINSWTTVNSMS